MKIIGINKNYGKLKMKYYKIPNASYTNRCGQMKNKILIILIMIPYAINAQLDSVFFAETEYCTIRKLDTIECLLGVEKANILFDKEMYYITNVGQFHPCPFNTKDYLMEYKYNLKTIGGSDILDSENCCFLLHSHNLLNERFGLDFDKKVKTEADSLDELGMGFIQPKFSYNNKNIFEYINCKISKSINVDSIEYFAFAISISINNLGESNYSFIDVETNKIVDNSLTKEFKRLIGKLPNWHPAMYRGKSIDISYITFVFKETIENICP